MSRAEELIERQRSTIKMLMKENEELRRENELLKATLREVAKMWEVDIPPEITLPPELMVNVEQIPWTERSKRFAGVRSQLLRIIVDLCRVRGMPVNYEDIRREYRKRYLALYMNMKSPSETINRCVRTLRDWGYLTSPKPGWFYPTDKAVKQVGVKLKRRGLERFIEEE